MLRHGSFPHTEASGRIWTDQQRGWKTGGMAQQTGVILASVLGSNALGIIDRVKLATPLLHLEANQDSSRAAKYDHFLVTGRLLGQVPTSAVGRLLVPESESYLGYPASLTVPFPGICYFRTCCRSRANWNGCCRIR